ncbi:UPF0481 protein At3g47200-like [Hevea brasiliensis]|uniref:UPF0481 protein At3g47200-like n=1 Tax=Hevea brasiliensis TaxID=3981 RepID=UPI0025D5231F|nr:UPF0481 protein At3g47200-like [Hevea brasiliensis]
MLLLITILFNKISRLSLNIEEFSCDDIEVGNQNQGSTSGVPKLPSCCSIFRVPRSLMEIHPKAFQPQIVSIGPYHHGREHLQMIQQQKLQYLHAILARTQGVDFDDFCKSIANEQKAMRECYSESTDKYSDHDFIEMLVLDGCFIIELFLIVEKLVEPDLNDPIFNQPWILYSIMRDLLRLENQIPFFVLQTLFELSKSTLREVPSLTELILRFFHYIIRRPDEIRDKHKNQLDGEHLLHLFRSSFIPSSKLVPTGRKDLLQLIQPVEKLRVAGIEFKQPVETAESFLDIKFRRDHGVLEIPHLAIDDSISSLILNCVALEQCYKHCSTHFTSYVIFMGCLINTPVDAGYLRDHRIIENFFGTDTEVVKFFNEVGKDICFDIRQSYLAKLFEDVNDHYRNVWHVRWAGFKHAYFDSPWTFISAIAALILLILTFIQAFFAVYGYVNPP